MGGMAETSERQTLVRHVSVQAAPERVWQLLTREEELPAWFCDGAHMETKVGGRVEWRWATECGTRTGAARIEDIVPGKRMVIRSADDGCWPGTVITMSLRPDGYQTILTITHEGLTRGENVAECQQFWHRAMESAKYYAETGQLPAVVWTAEQIQERICQERSATMGTILGYLIPRFGAQVMTELQPLLIKAHAGYYRSFDLQSPIHFAALYAQEQFNVYGEHVEVRGNANRVTVERFDRAAYEQCQKAGFPADYASFCQSSANYALSLARELGFSAETEIVAEGYRLHLAR
jgi:uncharacterized protein YndB with AHSA1/START domain